MNFVYGIEPIVSLSGSSFRWAELLLKHSRCLDMTLWREWYNIMPVIAAQVCQTHGLDRLSINLDSRHVLDDQITDYMEDMRRLPVCLEWTERQDGTPLDKLPEVADRLKALRRRHGFMLALDDYGRGEDGLGKSCLLSPDVIKLDGHLFQRSKAMAVSIEFFRCIIDAYQKSNIEIVVEWIESFDDFLLARNIGADFGQGYFWTHAKGQKNMNSNTFDMMPVCASPSAINLINKIQSISTESDEGPWLGEYDLTDAHLLVRNELGDKYTGWIESYIYYTLWTIGFVSKVEDNQKAKIDFEVGGNA